MRRMLGVVLGGLMLLGACSDSDNDSDATASGGDGNGTDADAYIEAVAAEMTQDAEGFSLDQEAATCFAAAAVNTIGVDKLEAAGVTPEAVVAADSFTELDIDIPDGAVDDLSTALEECGLAEAFADALVAGMSSSSGGAVSPDSASCLSDNVDGTALARAAAESSFSETDSGDTAFGDVFGEAFGACPDLMAEILVATFGASSGTELPDTAVACITDYVAENTDAVAKGFSGAEAEGSDALGTELAAACPEARAGVGG